MLYIIGLCGSRKFRFSVGFRRQPKPFEVDEKPNFSVFKHFSVLTLKPLIANHKTANLMLKLNVIGAQS